MWMKVLFFNFFMVICFFSHLSVMLRGKYLFFLWLNALV
ncbi:Hypothetical protein ETEE_3357 [Edwardsiella anguillarum ET080813]|uniref:Uncharacterized protein n=1 Tax=Edwardsiella anguillarum ET080813 TaxID=667120 RepID=A0A076LWB9_9GAMM|nr:Hypothetical protein ETEE_3357 [Edwardsiella anguillarum ET080813]